MLNIFNTEKFGSRSFSYYGKLKCLKEIQLKIVLQGPTSFYLYLFTIFLASFTF